ncbi:metallophosphoesterase family protein [Terrisporobacter mayombei]|uniref:Phosphoesterase n=1 Tax=Terrisporobacter mayombei TaxID=1541 RepID=A0ABY9Q835_9FIRM|nr:metallophosphoesterase family protein [Terrisporobacter mayombei]WMT83230.1 hypothetical protein TEMA_37330 [Terrisporobacter mayombei]
MKGKYMVGIISDTHGLLREEVINYLKKCDYIVHGGDINSEDVLKELKNIAPVYALRGNNDKGEWAEKLPKELYFNIGNIRFYMVHNKKEISPNLKSVDVIIFGHSHKYFCEKIEEILWLNPGSCGKRRFGLPINFIIMTIENNSYNIEKIDIMFD